MKADFYVLSDDADIDVDTIFDIPWMRICY